MDKEEEKSGTATATPDPKEGASEESKKETKEETEKVKTASTEAAPSSDATAGKEPTRPKTPQEVLDREETIYAHQRQVDSELAEAEAEARAYEVRMRGQAKELRTARIRTKVQNMLASGFLVPAQLEAGLISALASIPKGTKVGEQEALDVILNCLTISGKLMLKDQIAQEVEIDSTGPDADLDRLIADGFAGAGIDVERERRKIMAAAKNDERPISYVDALLEAQKRVAHRGGGM